MPGVLKLPTISPLHYYSPPTRKSPTTWTRIRILSTTTVTVSSAVPARRINNHTTYPTTQRKRWWSRITDCAPPVHFNKIANNPHHNNQLQLVGVRGRKSFGSSSSFASDEGKGRRRNCDNSGGGMGATYASSDDDTKDNNNNNNNNNNKHNLDGKKPPPEKLLTLPTILTIGRVAAVPLLVSTFYANSWWGPNATTVIFIAAAITDWLDGYLARKMNLGTAFGAFLDPVADKLMVAATLILLCTRPLEVGFFGQAPWLVTVPAIAIIGREITMSAVREWAASQDSKLSEAVAVNNLGKWKTATQMIALTILLAARDSSLIGSGTLASSGVVLLYVSAWLSVWSLVVYMRKIWKFLV